MRPSNSIYLLLVFFHFTVVMIGQSTKETVILLNSNPVLAEITYNAEIKKIIREEPEFLKGFILKVPDYAAYLEESAIVDLAQQNVNAPSLSSSQSSAYVENHTSSQSLLQESLIPVNESSISSSGSIHSQGYAVVTSEFTEIKFDEGYATLDTESTQSLDAVIKYMKSKPQCKVLIRSLNFDKSSVTKNRIDAITFYLTYKGVSSNDIIYEPYFGDMNLDSVKIHFIE